MPILTSAPAVLWALAGTLACIGLATVGADTAAGSVVGFAAEQVGALAIAVQAATTLDSAAAARPAIGAASVVAIAAVVAAIAPDFAVAVADFAAVVVSTAAVVGTAEAMAEVTVGAIADHDRQALILLRRVAKQSSSLPFFRVVFYRGRTTLG